jgi:hypothetical protein
MNKVKLILGASILLLSAQAGAALINYDEAIDGDIPGDRNET